MRTTRWIMSVLMTIALAAGASIRSAQADVLAVTNVRVVPHPLSRLMDVTYDLTTSDGLAATVTMYLSTDGGVTYPTVCQSVSGDVGSGVMPGTARHIVWDAGTDAPGLNSGVCRLRISADDGHAPPNTLTAVFTTQDPTNIVYPTGAGHLDSLRVQSLIAAIASADTVFRLGTGYDVPTFAYSEIDHQSPDGFKDPNGVGVGLKCDGSQLVGTGRFLNLHFPHVTRRAELVYIPWQNCLPANATIVSATMNVAILGSAYFAFTDSVIATQLSNPSDNQWYLTKGVGPNYPDFAHASWNYQTSSNGGAWGGSTGNPWSPALDQRKMLWDVGEINDWSGTTNPALDGYTPSSTSFSIKLTNCVQSVVSGAPNNGIALCYAEYSSFPGAMLHFTWDDYASARGRTPFVVVKYRTTPYVKPFGTSDWVFMANTDDGIYQCNNAYTDIFLQHGGKYTIFVAKIQVGRNYGFATARQLLEFHSRGMEIGNHSYYHQGLTHWTREMTMPDTLSAAWDSLKFDASPHWMYTMADSVVGDLRGDPTFAKSFALPLNLWSPEVLLVLEKFGYGAIRTQSSSGVYDRDRYYTLAQQRPGKTDTISTGVPSQFGRRPRNMSALPPFNSMTTIAGYKANPALTQASLDSIKTNMHRAIFQIRGQDRRALNLYWHDFKTNPSGSTYGEGVNANELDAMLNVVDQLGGRYMTTSEYTEWIKARATAVATPAGYAQPDTFKVQASDRVWFVPDD